MYTRPVKQVFQPFRPWELGQPPDG